VNWVYVAATLWALILVVVCCRVIVSPYGSSVYPIYADAARNWLAGLDLYGEGSGYRYSPLVAILLVPLSLVPDVLGGVLWRLLNAGTFLGALAWWSRSALPVSLTQNQRAVLFLLIAPLSIGCLNNGQSNPLVLGLLLAAVSGVAGQRWNLTSLCLALASLFKIYPIALGLLLVALYPRHLLGRLALALSLGLLLPFLFQQPSYVATQYSGWLHHLRTDDRHDLPLDLTYRDVRLLCRVWLEPLSPATYVALQVLAGAGIAGLCLAARRRLQASLLAVVLGLGCCWMTLFGPATESCTYILLAPSLAWAVIDLWPRGREQSPWPQRTAGYAVLASYLLLVTAQSAVWVRDGKDFRHLGPQPFAGLLLLGVLVVSSMAAIPPRAPVAFAGSVSYDSRPKRGE